MALRVIGAGFGRTGTDSMREALEILGFGPCHHMRDVMTNPEQKQLWRALAAGAEPDWARLLGGYASCMDWPSARYWPQLISAFPEAQVILTWRPAESWWASFETTILPLLTASNDTEATSPGSRMVAEQVFGGRPDDREHAIACYLHNVAQVRQMVPRRRLLVHSLGDGWAPLCAFLKVPVPDQPYPKANPAKGFADRVVFGAGLNRP
jgi:hypothetical protein